MIDQHMNQKDLLELTRLIDVLEALDHDTVDVEAVLRDVNGEVLGRVRYQNNQYQFFYMTYDEA